MLFPPRNLRVGLRSGYYPFDFPNKISLPQLLHVQSFRSSIDYTDTLRKVSRIMKPQPHAILLLFPRNSKYSPEHPIVENLRSIPFP